MNRIEAVFERKKHKALIPYITAGYPDVATTLRAAGLLAQGGSDIIELGIPFSDPLADGATIQQASFGALQNGVTPQVCLDIAAQIRQATGTPLVFMSYFNPVLSYGLKAFCDACARAGVDGLIIPDLPPEEGGELEALCRERGLCLVYLLAPTASEERIRLVSRRSAGFIYLVSLTGVTGARRQLSAGLDDFVARVRKATHKPLCVGFGISTAEQARQAAGMADGVIVGSRIIQLIEKDRSLAALREFVAGLRSSLDSL